MKSVRIRSDLRRKALYQTSLQTLAQKILRQTRAHNAELSVAFVGDRRMRQLNRRYRGLDSSTDVLAFATREGPGPGSSLLGDVVISLDTAVRQAETAGHSVDQEVVMLLIHGVLHLLGYDHEGSHREARRMHLKERSILQGLKPLPKVFMATKAQRR